jgi:hypothetical protein
MGTIRPALLDKFGVIPVIELYRQAVVRSQKAKNWPAMREWAERGIRVYGDLAARADAVDDLHKRLAYAMAKIEQADRPRPRRPRAATVKTANAVSSEVETLVCVSCGANFERVRTRGRKPRTCPDCRGLTTDTVSA